MRPSPKKSFPSSRLPVCSALLLCVLPLIARADTTLPAWNEPGDLPVPSWAKAIAPKRAEVPIFRTPGESDQKRGTTMMNVRLPLYGMKRGSQCGGRWMLVGPEAWVCSDAMDLVADPPFVPDLAPTPDGLPFHYYFVGRNGAPAFTSLLVVPDMAPDATLDPGFAVAIGDERVMAGQPFGRSHSGYWIPLRDLGAARPSGFHGEDVSVRGLSIGWILPDHANVYSAPSGSAKVVGSHVRFEVVGWREEKTTFVRVSDDGVTPAAWMKRSDLAHPSLAAPPSDAGPGEKWIDVELASQTLVAYVGDKPTFATLVSTGRGAKGSETATPPGTHRLWVKLTSSTMDNLPSPNEEASSSIDEPVDRFSIEDVPYVQFFDRGVALHGAFWHSSFGKPKSHGCVNLSPLDARALFEFTAPHLPRGWSAVLPSSTEKGTLIRIR